MADRTRWQQIARRIRVPMGFAVAAAFLFLARPTVLSLTLSLLLVLPGVWFRAYAAGYIRKNKELTTTGPYGYTRNPLYLGSMLITAGFGAAAASWLLPLLLAALFAAIYLPTIRSEEIFLRATFPTFDAYAARVPRLLPRLTPAPLTPLESATNRGHFSRTLYLHHREYNACIGSAAIYLALILRLALGHVHTFPTR